VSITSTLVGNLGSDAEVRYTADGRSIVTFSVASTRSEKNMESGAYENVTDWVRVTTMPKDTGLEYIQSKAVKGAKVTVIGKTKVTAYISKKDQEPKPSIEMPFPYEIIWQGAGQARTAADEDEAPARAPAANGAARKPAGNQRAAAKIDDDSDLNDLPF
jgi:single-strand DNA-binding protein